MRKKVAIAGGGLAGLTCAKYLADEGMDISLYEGLPYLGGRASTFRDADGERVEADFYAAAVPAWAFAPLVPGPLRDDPFFAGIGRLPVAPAVSVQLWFDRPAFAAPEYALVGRSLTPVYQEQSFHTYPVARGGRVSVIVAPADGLLERGEPELVATAVRSLSAVNRTLAGAALLKSVVLKHPQHLIRPLPGAMSARPTQRTPVPNLFLAGDWTRQEFFGSQEGAVRGGKACAHAVLEESKTRRIPVRPG